jgi:hypothetical protein
LPNVWATFSPDEEVTERQRMVSHISAQLQCELERRVHNRTGRRIRDLAIELAPECVILHGRATTYYVKQLAQHGIRDVLPQVPLENAIVVDQPV